MNAIESSPTFDIGSIDDSMSPTHSDHIYHEVEKFCTPDSLEASSNYINILLTSYGYPVPLVFNSTEADDKCKIVNCLYSLINDRKNDAKEREDLIASINNLKKDKIELENQVVNLKRENKQKEKQHADIRAKLEANEVTHKKQLLQNTRLREEVSKVKNNMQYIKTQYTHETKKHEQELAKGQDRLTKSMSGQFRVKVSPSLEANSHFATTINNTADNDAVVQIRNMYTDLLQKANDRESELKAETVNLRTCLENLYTGVRRLLENQIRRFDNDTRVATKPRDSYAETARFRLPMDCGGKEAMVMVQDLLVRLKEEWDQQIDQSPHEFTSEDMMQKEQVIISLQNTVQESMDTMEQMKQEYEEKTKMYRRFEKGGFFDTLYPTPKDAHMSDSEDSVVDLETEDRYKYRVLRKKAMRDQRRVTESAIELGQQRAQLEAERWAFQEMRRELQMKEILEEGQTPPAPPQLSRKQSMGYEYQPDRARKRLKSWLGSAPSNN